MPTTARIVQFHRLGGPEVLQVETLPIPEPGKDEVRLRIKAFALNRAEALFRQGHYLIQPQFPSRLGYEAAGMVEAVGPGVDESLIGKVFNTVPNFSFSRYGVYGEVAMVPVTSLGAYPDKLTPEEGASIWMQYLTAYGALVHLGHVANGDFVLLPAASSSTAIAAMEVVNAEGGKAIGITRSAKKKAELLSLGYDHVIVSNDEDVVKRVADITDGNGARIIYDPVLGSGMEILARAAAYKGIYFAYGLLDLRPTPFPVWPTMSKALTLRGWAFPELFRDAEALQKAKDYIFKHLSDGILKPKIARVFALDQIVEAHRFMDSNDQIGKIIVRVE
ncbi:MULTISPECIES: zinc-dependent alcohol dehydrogenase family protein [Rhizobium]|uniref:NADPH:quinone reductase n=2 Tax=Rhizobium TaxID=379 RepID=A0A387FZY1_9HYPH|nr:MULTISPECIES: zinc-dependent alcohol dehydrogenase family protein [Rhizobium]AYG64219.1 NADPH:quinone reductase [Rhizobium jaguaris]MDL2403124.1 zinc-dependent alcohol dehydrogenase family protein [Rhizobium mayense]